MATVQKLSTKTDSYRITVSMGYDMHGKQIRKTMTWKPEPGMTPKQIQKELERQKLLFEEKCRNGIVIDDSIRFHEFAARWMEDYAKTEVRTKTYDRYAAMLPRINEAIGNLKLSEIKTMHLRNFYKSLSEEGSRLDIKYQCSVNFMDLLHSKNLTKAAFTESAGVSISVLNSITQGKNISTQSAEKIAKALNIPINKLFVPINAEKGLSGKTILHHHRLISSILSTAVEWEVLLSNPCNRIKPPKVEKSRQIILQMDEAARMLELLEAEPIQYKTMLITLLFTGLRRGELLGLEWQDIDFEQGTITVERSSLYSKEKGVFTDSTKNETSQRTLETSDFVFETLRQYKIWQIEQRLKMGDLWKNSNRLFTSLDGAPMHPDVLTNWFSNFVKKSDLPNLHIHSLRHTHASFLIAEGVPLPTVSKAMGHANVYTTLSIYAHAVETHERVVAKTMDQILSQTERKIM